MICWSGASGLTWRKPMPDDVLGRLSDFGLPMGEDPPPMSEAEFMPAHAPAPEGVVPLGYDRGTFFYLSQSARQVFALSHAQHSKTALMAMASTAHYWQRSRFVTDK